MSGLCWRNYERVSEQDQRDGVLFLGGGGVACLSEAWTVRIGFILVTFCWGRTIVCASLRLTHLALMILVSRSSWILDLRDYSSWQLLHRQTGFNKRVHSAANHSRDLVVLSPLFIEIDRWLVCGLMWRTGDLVSYHSWGLDYIHTYKFLFPVQSNQSITSC